MLGGVEIAQPDTLGYSFETTYTSDSGRVQSGLAVTTPMFTVESFSFGYSFLTLAQARQILQIIMPGKAVDMHYPSVYYGGWRTSAVSQGGGFYCGRGQVSWGTIIVNEEIVEDFQFNMIGVAPIDTTLGGR